jgi:hypothetical protein
MFCYFTELLNEQQLFYACIVLGLFTFLLIITPVIFSFDTSNFWPLDVLGSLENSGLQLFVGVISPAD